MVAGDRGNSMCCRGTWRILCGSGGQGEYCVVLG